MDYSSFAVISNLRNTQVNVTPDIHQIKPYRKKYSRQISLIWLELDDENIWGWPINLFKRQQKIWFITPFVCFFYTANGRVMRNSDYPAGIEITPNLQDALGQTSKYDKFK